MARLATREKRRSVRSAACAGARRLVRGGRTMCDTRCPKAWERGMDLHEGGDRWIARRRLSVEGAMPESRMRAPLGDAGP